MLTEFQNLEIAYLAYHESLGKLLEIATPDNLRKLRTDLGLKSGELANWMNCHKTMVSGIECYHQPVSTTYIAQYIEAIKKYQNAGGERNHNE